MDLKISKKENFGLALAIAIVIAIFASIVIILSSLNIENFYFSRQEDLISSYSGPISTVEEFTDAENVYDKSQFLLKDSKADLKLRNTMPVPIGSDKLIDQKIEPVDKEEIDEEQDEVSIRQKITYLYRFNKKKQRIERTNTYDLNKVEGNWLISNFITEIENVKEE